MATISRGQSVARWQVSRCRETPFAGTAKVLPDIDYRFFNGIPPIGELPCREAFREAMVGRAIDLPVDWAFDELRLSDGTPRVDYSDFWHVPTHVARAARCTLTVARATEARFRLSTCGGVVIWVEGVESVRFEPFTRNQRQTAEVTLPLAAGENLITVHFEDLCERDTNWHFELQLVSDISLGVGVPAATDGDVLARHQAWLDGLRLNQLFFEDEPVVVICEPRPVDVVLDVAIKCSHGDKAPGVQNSVQVAAGATHVAICDGADAPPGCAVITLGVVCDGQRIEREIGATFLAQVVRGTGETIAARRQEVGRHLIDGARGGAARALLHLAHGVALDQAQALMEAEIAAAARRDDCSDFDIVALLWAWHDFAGQHLEAGFWDRLRSTILGYRFWLDEPGNDVMWFWSENHVLCFHTSQYLAGQLFPDAVFEASGRTGREQQELARQRLLKWFTAVEAHGFAEWNSAAYYPIDFIGLLALYQLAEDDEIRDRARVQLDRLFVMIALHSQTGVPAGSMGRAYEKELFAGASTELATFAHIAWGGGWIGVGVKSAPLMCLSDYVPPSTTQKLARPNGTITAAYTQGLDHLAQLTLWKDDAGLLSTVTEHGPGEPGHQQHVIDVQMAGHPNARLWINRPGDHRPWGSLRPSYWAGNAVLPNVAQAGPLALMVYGGALPDGEDLPTYSHVFCPVEVCDQVMADDNWLFAQVGDGFAGIYATGGLNAVTTGLYAGAEWRCETSTCGWLVTLGSRRRDGDFAAFQRRCRANTPTFDADARVLAADHKEHRLALGATGPLRIDGRAVPFDHRHPGPAITVDEDG